MHETLFPRIGQDNELGLSLSQKEGFNALSSRPNQSDVPNTCAPLQANPSFLQLVVGRFEEKPSTPVICTFCTEVGHPLAVILAALW
jgi:hypothetical protein